MLKMKQSAMTILTIVCLQFAALGQFPNKPAGMAGPPIPQPAMSQPIPVPGVQQSANNFGPQLQPNPVAQETSRRIQQQRAALAEIEADMREDRPVQYELPDQGRRAGAEAFRRSFAEINGMLEGRQDLSLKRAVYLAEAPTYGNLDYTWFCHLIQRETDFVKTALAAENLSLDNADAVKWMLYRLFSDTVQVGKDKRLPFRYDFEDPFGRTDYTKMLVTKLLTTRKGQCHSMPLLYLILAEELEMEAWLAYSPQHSYIKVKNAKGIWFNFETTNGHYTNDNWILSCNFIKAEAIRQGIYLDTLSRRELVASCLKDLANGYVDKYEAYDRFALQCAEKTLQYHPNNISALKLKANYRTDLFHYVVWQLGYPHPSTIHRYPEAYDLLRLRDETYDRIDRLGYEDMPEEVYTRWLQSFEAEKSKQPVEIIRP